MTKNTAKLDRETEELHHDRVPLEVGKVIQLGRQENGLTQKDLATVSRKTCHVSAYTVCNSCWVSKISFNWIMSVGCDNIAYVQP